MYQLDLHIDRFAAAAPLVGKVDSRFTVRSFRVGRNRPAEAKENHKPPRACKSGSDKTSLCAACCMSILTAVIGLGWQLAERHGTNF